MRAQSPRTSVFAPPNSPNSSLNYIFWQNVRLSQPIFLLFQFFSAEIAFRESNQ
jgi:hypothetical protein